MRQGRFSFQSNLHLRRPDATSATKHQWARDPVIVALLAITLILAGAIPLWLHYKSQLPAGDPSEADARKVFEYQREQLEDGAAHVLTFKKVHSESQNILGVIVHFVDYEAEIRIPNRGQTDKFTGRLAFKLTDDGWLGEDGQLY